MELFSSILPLYGEISHTCWCDNSHLHEQVANDDKDDKQKHDPNVHLALNHHDILSMKFVLQHKVSGYQSRG